MVAGWVAAASIALGAGAAIQEGAPKADSIDAVVRDFNAALARSNYRLKETQVVPLIERCWKLRDAQRGTPAEFTLLERLLDFATYSEGAAVDDAWREVIEQFLAAYVDDPRLAPHVARGVAPKRLAPEFDAFLAEVEATTGCIDLKAAFALRELRPLLDAEALGQLEDAAGRTRLIAALAQLKQQFPAVKVPDEGSTYAEFADQLTWAIENLRPGKPAPEIVGRDLEGAEFKLSDYRGKVVLLDFWGFW